jgi:hypothetical protein
MGGVAHVTPQKFHCVTQLRKDSWEYRVKGDHEEPNEDDLVSMDDYLRLHDQLRLEYQAHDNRQVQVIEALRLAAAAHGRALLELQCCLADTAAALTYAKQDRDEARALFAQAVERLEGELERAQKGRE